MSNTRDKDTRELTQILKSTGTKKELEDVIGEQLTAPQADLPSFLAEKLLQSHLSKSEIVHRSGLHRTYAYQIFQGVRQPSRNKLIALCIAMELPLEEVPVALRTAGLSMLYSKNRRDAVLIFAVSHRRSCMDTNFLLDEFGEEILE